MEVQDIHEIDDIQAFEILNNPTRLRILRQMVQPRSVKQLAAWLDVPPTRLYYHVNLLEEIGVIRVAETRKVGAMTEKLYQTTARNFRPGPGLMSGDHDADRLASVAAAVVLDSARIDAEAGLRRHFEDVHDRGDSTDQPAGSIGRTVVYLTSESRGLVNQKITELLEFMDELDAVEDGEEFGFSFVFFPVAGGRTR